MANRSEIELKKWQLNYKYRFELSNLNKILDRVDAIKELYDEIEDGTKNKIGYNDANIDDLLEELTAVTYRFIEKHQKIDNEMQLEQQ